MTTPKFNYLMISPDLTCGQVKQTPSLRRLIKVLKYFIIVVLSGLQVSCYTKVSKPSVIVIAVDQLEFSNVRCGWPDQSDTSDGAALLCQEFQRFTHLYLPSLDTLPSMASLLTGLSLTEHGLIHQTVDYLPNDIQTTAESAFQKKYKTAFFSGGAPALSRTGLNQGFQLFDDIVSLEPYKLFRKASVNQSALEKWLQNIDDEEPVFIVVNYSDIFFPEVETVTPTGETRKKSRDSQVEEVLISIEKLFQFLKSENRYNSSWIFLAGVSSSSSITARDLRELSQVHVAGFVKEPFQTSPKNYDADLTLIEFGQGIKHAVLNPESKLSLADVPTFKVFSTKLHTKHPADQILTFSSGLIEIERSQPSANFITVKKSKAPQPTQEYLRNPTLELIDIKIAKKNEDLNFIWPLNEL